MTVQDLINLLGGNSSIVFIYFGIILIATLLFYKAVNEQNINQLKYVASAIVYGVCVPGILSLILTFYSLFILNASLLNVNALIYFLPILVMILTLYFINKKVYMKQIPGFEKLSGLMIIIGVSFILVFILQRTYFGVLFIGGIFQLLIAFVVIFIILKVALKKLNK